MKVATKRLIIKEITLENFKSYEGKQTIGPFHKVPTYINLIKNIYYF